MDDSLCVRVVKFKIWKSHIAEMLINAGFTINRTGYPFGNVSVDMTLE